jgi:hypothetical protein
VSQFGQYLNAAPATETITTLPSGTVVLPIAGTINMVGAGGTVVTGDAVTGTVTVTSTAISSIASTIPGWGPLTGAITFSNGNNITITNPAGSAVSFAVTGTTNHAIQLGNATGSLSSLAVGTTGQLLVGVTGADPTWINAGTTGVILTGVTGASPTWTTATYPATTVLGDVLVASAANVIGVVNGATAGTVFIGNAAAAPSFSANPTVTTMYATTFDTNVATAKVTLSGTTLAAGGSNANVGITLTPKGTGALTISSLGLGAVLSSSSGVLSTTGAGTAGQLVASGGAGVSPAWTTTTYPVTSTLGDVLVASAANVIGVVNGATAGTVFIGNASTAPSFSSTPTVTTMYATTFNTNVPAAAVTLSGTTLAALGSNADINITITPKGSGALVVGNEVMSDSFYTTTSALNASFLNQATWQATGTGIDVSMNIIPKGSGIVTIGGTSGKINALTFNTEVATAAINISGTTISTVGSNPDVNLTITPQFAAPHVVGTVVANAVVEAYEFDTITNPALALSLSENGIYAFSSNPLDNVDLSVTTQGTGAFVIDCLPADSTLNSQWRTAQAYVQTTDATVTTIVSIPLAQKQMITVSATINGFKSTYNHAAAGTISSSAFRPNAGNITVVGQHQINFAADAGATATVNIVDAINVGTQSFELHVTGAAGETWNWVTTYSYSYTTNP